MVFTLKNIYIYGPIFKNGGCGMEQKSRGNIRKFSEKNRCQSPFHVNEHPHRVLAVHWTW